MLKSILNLEGVSALSRQQHILIFLIMLPMLASAQFTVEGKILDAANAEDLEMSLNIYSGKEMKIPAKIEGSNFSIVHTLSEPTNGMLTIKNSGERKSFKILLDNSSTYNVSIFLEDEDEYFNNNKWYKIETESSYHNVWTQFYDEQNKLVAKKKETFERYENGKITKQELDEIVQSINFKINQQFKDLAREKPSNYSVPYILTGAPDLSKIYRASYNNLSDEVKNSYWGKRLKKILDSFDGSSSGEKGLATPILGTKFIPLKGKGLNNGNLKIFNPKKLDSKLTLIDFWASWCGPCRKENIEFGILNNSYDDEDLKIISFSLDTRKEDWKKASNKDNISWENISDLKGTQSVVMENFQIKQLPRNLLIDAKGNIVAVNKFGSKLKEFVRNYLKEFQ